MRAALAHVGVGIQPRFLRMAVRDSLCSAARQVYMWWGDTTELRSLDSGGVTPTPTPDDLHFALEFRTLLPHAVAKTLVAQGAPMCGGPGAFAPPGLARVYV